MMDVSSDFGDAREQSFSSSSTPLSHAATRKRKHNEILEFCPSSPKFSSTFNESLISDFKGFGLEGSLPNTPEKQIKIMTKTVAASPIEESRKILYSKLKTVKPERKIAIKTKYVHCGTQNLLKNILNINVVMDVIFKYLSGGDLYRFSLVSDLFHITLEKNKRAFDRYMEYRDVYRDNKENYAITPPGSPEKGDSPPRSTENFNKFIRTASRLTRSQSLIKCRKCEGVAIVENNISQCQNVNVCGLIYCLLCSSLSETGPKDFRDKCGNAVLRPTLSNVSNCMDEFSYSLNISHQDSGFYSENESPPKVKRNLFSTSLSEVPRTLSILNRNTVVMSQKRREDFSYVPVVKNTDFIQRQADCDSPPRTEYAVGSQRSKRNLKRLTR